MFCTLFDTPRTYTHTHTHTQIRYPNQLFFLPQTDNLTNILTTFIMLARNRRWVSSHCCCCFKLNQLKIDLQNTKIGITASMQSDNTTDISNNKHYELQTHEARSVDSQNNLFLVFFCMLFFFF